MSDEVQAAPGTRERNMQLRRSRILRAARRLIAEQGYDALSTRVLAKAAGVSQPTLYNLIGSKEEIVRSLLLETTGRITDHIQALAIEDPIEWAEATTARIIEVFREDETYYRAAVIAGDRNIDLFADQDDEEERAPFIGVKATALTRALFNAQIDRKSLRGNVSAAALSATLYAVFRTNLRDWAYDQITLESFAKKTLSAHYLVLAADAEPALRRRLLEKHEALEAS